MLVGAIAGAYNELAGNIFSALMDFFNVEPPPLPGPRPTP